MLRISVKNRKFAEKKEEPRRSASRRKILE